MESTQNYQNYQNAQSSQWVAYFNGFPDLIFKLKSFILPTISMGVSELGGGDYTGLTLPGDHLEYDDIQLDFIVDSNYKNYRRLLAWMKYNARHPDPYLSDITIHLLDNQGNFQGVSFNYQDGFPVFLSSVTLESDIETTDIFASTTIKINEIQILDEDGQEENFQFGP